MKAIEKIYHTFYETKNRWLYFSKIKQKTKLSNSSLQNALKRLEKKGEIEIEKQSSNIFFKIPSEKKKFIFPKIDKEKFDNLNHEIRIPLKNWLKKIPSELEYVLLFGSASRKQEKENSDIDILIALHKFQNEKLQNLYEREIKKRIEKATKEINSESNHPLKVIITDINKIKTKKDHLINQAKETGFPLFGNIEYHSQNEENQGLF